MSRIRTDVDIMPQNELDAWTDNILSGVHREDIITINDILTRELKIDKLERLAKRDFKACDRCYSTYPNNIVRCQFCPGNRKLRTFKVVMDLDAEIQKVRSRK
jgi:ribosomal protein L40E